MLAPCCWQQQHLLLLLLYPLRKHRGCSQPWWEQALAVEAVSLAQLAGGRSRGVRWMPGMDWLLCASSHEREQATGQITLRNPGKLHLQC